MSKVLIVIGSALLLSSCALFDKGMETNFAVDAKVTWEEVDHTDYGVVLIDSLNNTSPVISVNKKTFNRARFGKKLVLY